ncbi:Altered inheritance of mitochondria protein 6 [Aspergillus alliaceus]|uniref:Altered inheritance of mitochondria protein 6 n=1 Tax=Petromyces alliaceus TaxID=209559 RepID=A0A8H6E2L2_PETAA|nr:Altered inheritance of mitochondria protein 6 [Aspergillus burnettii]
MDRIALYSKSFINVARVTKNKALRNRIVLFIIITTAIGGLALMYVFCTTPQVLIDRLTPTESSSGLHQITKSWKKPSDSVSLLSPWPIDWSQGIIPIPCHSHNDYRRRVPLYDALAAGCTGVEADIWLDSSSQDLLVGHKKRSLSPDRTLKTLYIDPLFKILSCQNIDTPPSAQPTGVFDANPNTTLALLIDMKTDGKDIWPVLMQHLEPLRSQGWLTYWNGTAQSLVPGAITVVGTGNTPFAIVAAERDRRDVFFDAPLDQLSRNETYTSENSYYASVALERAVGKIWPWGPSQRQKLMIRDLIDVAITRGLVSRFWDISGWPVALQVRLWNVLIENGVGMLNVDDLVHASRWNWDWCVVASLVLC